MRGDLSWGVIMDIVVWLRSLGLGKYETAFRDNEIDETVLPSLTHRTSRSLASLPRAPAQDYSMRLRPASAHTGVKTPAARSPRPVPRMYLPRTAPSAAK